MAYKRGARRIFRKRRLAKRLAAAVSLGLLLPAHAALAAGETNENPLTDLVQEDLIITAERIPTNKWDTPANVTVITAEEIEANHYQDVGEALSHVNGVFVSGNATYLNGTRKIAILLDGQRLDKDSGMLYDEGFDWKIIPSMKMIERIEVVKGGNSALYGSDAIGGVINIITKKGRRNETVVDVNTGSWSRHNYEIANQGVKDSFSWFVAGGLGRSKSHTYKNYGSPQGVFGNNFEVDRDSPGRGYSDKSLFARLDNKFDDRSSVTLSFMHRSNDERYSRFISKLYNNVALTYKFKEGTTTPGFLRYFNDYKSTDDPRWYRGLTTYTSRMQGVEYQNGWELGKNHRLIAGFEWHQNKATTFEDDNLSAQKVTNQSYYLQDTMSLGEKWSFVPGVRLDKYSSFGHQWSPKAALNYRPDDKTKFYISGGRIFRAPRLYQLHTEFSRGAYAANGFYEQIYYSGSPDLSPETGHTETIGMEHDFDENTNIAMSFFSANVKHGIDWSNRANVSMYTGDPIINRQAVNANREKQRGVELSFRQKVGSAWSYDIGYSHTHSRQHYGVINYAEPVGIVIDDYIGGPTPYPQPTGGRLGVHYRKGPWKANLLGIMTTGRAVPYYAVRKYALFDFNVSYDVTDQLSVYARANNFFDKKRIGDGRFCQLGLVFSF